MPVSGPPLAQPFDTSKLLARGLALRPDEPALISKRARWSWRELDQVSTRFAQSLLDLGLAPGDRVASLMPNRCELIVFYIACMKAGLVAVPLNYRYKAPEIDHALAVSGASALFAHDERAEDIAASKRAGSLPLGVISYNDAGGSRSPTYAEFAKGSSARRLVAPDPRAPAIIFFTSGSTGKPKGVTHSFETLGWVIANMEGGYDIRSDDVWLPGSSMAHMGGAHLLTGALGHGGAGRRPAGVQFRGAVVAVSRSATDLYVDPAFGTLFPGARPRSQARRLCIVEVLFFRWRQGVARARDGVRGAGRTSDHRDLRHDRDRRPRRQPAAGRPQARRGGPN